METYHKIQTLFKRHLDGPKKGKMIRGDWTTPELEYLSDKEWTFTEKLDGTNIRVEFGPYATIDPAAWKGVGAGVNFGGRTNNATIPEPLFAVLQEKFTPQLFVDNELNGITLFGEGIGPKIQGGGKYSESGRDYKFVLFDVKIGDFWLSRENVRDVAEKLGVEHAPVIGIGTLHEAIEIVSSGVTFNDGGGVVRWGRGGLQSRWGDFEAEGIVARPRVDLFDRKGQRIITKIKAVDFR